MKTCRRVSSLSGKYTSQLSCQRADAKIFSLTYDEASTSFYRTSDNEAAAAYDACSPGKPCLSCGHETQRKKGHSWSILDEDAIAFNGISYHVHDFVYLQPSSPSSHLYDLAQIIKIQSADHLEIDSIQVRLYGRHTSLRGQDVGAQFTNTDSVSGILIYLLRVLIISYFKAQNILYT